MPPLFTANPTDVDEIVAAITRTVFYTKYFRWLELSKHLLRRYVKHSEYTWLDSFRPTYDGTPNFAVMTVDFPKFPPDDFGGFC